MVLIIHLLNGKVIKLEDRKFTQEQVNNFYQLINNGEGIIHYTETNGKNYMIPKDKILYIETKFTV
jgi:hypothetical protein